VVILISQADVYFKQQIQEILNNGYSDEEYEVRPTWPDGKKAHSKYITHSIFTWDNSMGVPIQTVRKIAWKAGLKEILALYQQKATTKEEFEQAGVFWWSPWFDDKGTLGKSYAYQLKKEIEFPEGKFNQIDRVIWLLKNKPMDRRIITNMLNLEEMKDMTLPPCAFMTMWSVRGKYLDMMLIQRSGDLLPAAGFGGVNTIQYYFLWQMISQVTGYEPGKFTHVINNLHIYDRHENIARNLLNAATYQSPKLILDTKITDFYAFSANSISLEGYQWDQDIKNIPIAE
jgi:thymidylate synthase